MGPGSDGARIGHFPRRTFGHKDSELYYFTDLTLITGMYVEHFDCSLLPVLHSLMGFIAAQVLEKYLSAIIRAITESTVNSPESAEETLLSHVRI